MPGRVVVIGLGNVFMKDDGVGIRVAKEVMLKVEGKADVYEYGEMDLSLLGYLRDASLIIIVDALRSGRSPGSVSKYLFSPDSHPVEVRNLHSMQLHDLLNLAAQTGVLTCPVTVIGVEPRDVTYGEGLSEEVRSALPAAVEAVMEEVDQRESKDRTSPRKT